MHNHLSFNTDIVFSIHISIHISAQGDFRNVCATNDSNQCLAVIQFGFLGFQAV